MINANDYLFKEFRLKENNSMDHQYIFFYDYITYQGINKLLCITSYDIGYTDQGSIAPDYTNTLNDLEEVNYSDEIKKKFIRFVFNTLKYGE